MPKVTGLEGVVAAETNISLVDGEKGYLIYRGYWAKELALTYTYEDVAYLLLFGRLPSKAEEEEFAQRLKEYRRIPLYVTEILKQIPHDVDMMSVLRTAISALGGKEFEWPPTPEQAIRVVALTPTLIAYRFHQQKGTSFVEPNPELDHIANYLYMLHGQIPEAAHARALTAYAILTMEHGMNASTFSARSILSTQSDLVSSVVGAIGSMKGPLHGGAPSGVLEMLNAIATPEQAEPWIRDKLEHGERIMGFGHRIYKTHDPRSVALRMVTQQLAGQDPWLDLARHVEDTAIKLLEEYKPGRRLYTNVEFYAAAVMQAISLPAELFTPTFTMSRMVGWTAHILEQVEYNRIFRPQSVYVGPMPKDKAILE